MPTCFFTWESIPQSIQDLLTRWDFDVFTNEEEVILSSSKHHQPLTFDVYMNYSFLGWDFQSEGLQSMMEMDSFIGDHKHVAIFCTPFYLFLDIALPCATSVVTPVPKLAKYIIRSIT